MSWGLKQDGTRTSRAAYVRCTLSHANRTRRALISPALGTYHIPPHTHHIHTKHTPHARTLHTCCAHCMHPTLYTTSLHTQHKYTYNTYRHTPLLGTWTPEDTSPKQAPPAGPAPTSTSEGTARSRVEPLPAHAQQTGAPVPFVIGGQRIPWPALQLDLEGHLRDGAAPRGAHPQAGRSARWPRTPHSSSRPEAP